MLSHEGSVVVFRDSTDAPTLFAYAPRGGGVYLALTFTRGRPTWRHMAFFEILDTVPVRHVVLHPRALEARSLGTVDAEWVSALHDLLAK